MFLHRVYLVRRHLMQRLTDVPQLSTGFLSAAAAQAARLRQLPLQSIRGGWLAAVVAVFGPPRFQVGETLLQAGILLQQRSDLLTLLGNLGFQCDDAILFGHGSMIHLLRKSA